MSDKQKVMRKLFESFKEIEQLISIKLIDEEPTFTGKIGVEINCNCGGITGVEVYTKRKIISNLNNNTGF
jgi:hypothetical protein